eukprot:CAMPEP_0179991026 /NCGR_PEP_ID=MMETSP0984-20121128/4772_1 /TAXON_ID=483367 /ORGANISM="non described non described, Strain CCMP 2436" /LENGTH=129 /DNA_ID=CAMNT_0021910303 /DNA_START=1166 /DNA_END=1555 /DNA_ORIENTATION=-
MISLVALDTLSSSSAKRSSDGEAVRTFTRKELSLTGVWLALLRATSAAERAPSAYGPRSLAASVSVASSWRTSRYFLMGSVRACDRRMAAPRSTWLIGTMLVSVCGVEGGLAFPIMVRQAPAPPIIAPV